MAGDPGVNIKRTLNSSKEVVGEGDGDAQTCSIQIGTATIAEKGRT